jgi:cellulose synthase/poly-beta-1,6-N-acetylglucosamine synthase-like glycosyltransferase
MRLLSPRVTVLRTPRNRLKAGALNLGLAHLLGRKGPRAPAVVLTLDDDVVIAPETVRLMTEALLGNPRLGAVCSRCGVLNKNANVLTRLQGLEYVGFNAIRLADQGFMRGPLVMHGMLTAFRARALRQAGPFAEGHLIEDYEMTTRLKTLGWEVRGVLAAPAWTEVPERLRDFWRQRTRWSLGGVRLVMAAKDKSVVIQDVLGHIVFIATLALIATLLVLKGAGAPSGLLRVIVALSVLQFAAWYALQVWLMRWYPEKDAWDWLLRVSLVPELLFSTIMTLVVLGSYSFMLFSAASRTLAGQGGAAARAAALGTALFAKLGYSDGWGTRSN